MREKWDCRFLEMAELVGSWSKDPSTKVGAVIVDKDRRIVSTGYNGFPQGIADRSELLNDREKKYKLIVH
jgi:dCMP deaminase